MEDNDDESIRGGNGLDTEEYGENDDNIEVMDDPPTSQPEAIYIWMLVPTMTLQSPCKPYLNKNPMTRRMILVVV